MPRPPAKTATPAAAQRITAWSFSRLNDYRKCPKFAFFKHVQRLKEPGNAAMERGGKIGEMAEKFAVAKAKAVCPPELATFEEEFRVLQKHKVMSEEEWAFTAEWVPTGWFDKDAWCRVKVDAFHMFKEELTVCGKVIDYKTGKLNPTHLDQLSLYALCAFCKYPELDAVEVQLWYLDHGVLLPDPLKLYSRDEVPTLKKEWEAGTRAMLADRRFVEKPGKACGWCHYSKGKDGPCKF